MNKLLNLLTLSLLSLCSIVCAQTESAKRQNENYLVYDAVIRRMFAGDKVTFDTQSKIKEVIIRQETTTDYAVAEKKEDWPEVKRRLPTLSDETIADFEANHKLSTALKRSFDLSLKYSLFSKHDFDIIFDAGSNIDRMADNWAKFYQKFLDSGGYVQLSNVGLNKSRDQALVFVVHWCGVVCGTGHYIVLNKKDQVWNVEQIGMIWVS